MPELPEVESLRRSLAADLVGARIERFDLRRDDIVRQAPDVSKSDAAGLPAGTTIASLERHGKQLAFTARCGRGMVIRLGMSGQLRWGDGRKPDSGSDHVHARWTLRNPAGERRTLEFRDPRRFGGLFPYASVADRAERLWSSLGPDAIDAATEPLVDRIEEVARASRRPLKSLLLDQSAVAGIGNIYADEALFAASLHPCLPSKRLARTGASRLVAEFRSILRKAIDAGGSTLRDYVDATGRAGSFQETHRVYGRAGQPCVRCSNVLRSVLVAGRTTVWCPRCQSRRSR
jgi:formamidopyrimidine-DNA glycosylase